MASKPREKDGGPASIEKHEDIFKGRRNGLSRAELLRLALPRLTRRLAATALWGPRYGVDWRPGDYRFLILEFAPDRGTLLYMQFWSEPGEPLLGEVVSGAWTPPARKYLTRPVRAAIRARGFKRGGQARNYQKQGMVEDLPTVRAVALEALEMMWDVFGYRGRQALQVVTCTGERLEPAGVLTDISIEDAARVLRSAGFVTRLESPPRQPPALRVARPKSAHWFAVFPHAPRSSTVSRFGALTCVAGLGQSLHVSLDEVNRMNASLNWGRISMGDDGALMLSMAIQIAGGVTPQYLVESFALWVAVWRAARRWVAQARGESATEPIEEPGEKPIVVH